MSNRNQDAQFDQLHRELLDNLGLELFLGPAEMQLIAIIPKTVPHIGEDTMLAGEAVEFVALVQTPDLIMRANFSLPIKTLLDWQRLEVVIIDRVLEMAGDIWVGGLFAGGFYIDHPGLDV